MRSQRVGHDRTTKSTEQYSSEGRNICPIRLPGFGVVPLEASSACFVTGAQCGYKQLPVLLRYVSALTSASSPGGHP